MPVSPEKIKQRRGSYRQAEIAPRAEMSAQQWNDIESGRKPDPRVSTLERMAQAMGCKVDDLLDPVTKLSPKRKSPRK
jgi:transcriptional regulator with XRE-family HTH domain